MNKNKQTAVMWLMSKFPYYVVKEYQEEFDQALQMEREQIVNAVDGFPIESRNLDGEQYYTNTYGE